MTPLTTLGTTAELDQLLNDVCIAIQLTETQYSLAEERYTTIGKWLAEPGTSIALFRPNIFPQGSVRLQTTVKPRPDVVDEEYDVDLVCLLELHPSLYQDPMMVYGMVENRLKENANYRGKIERFKRCLRINYANEFHLDITPACPDPIKGGTSLLVPDKNRRGWVASDPLGFSRWFDAQARRIHQRFVEKKVQPFPEQESAEEKAPLRRAVQLLKRRRDVVFEGDDNSPRSVALTTLAGHHYQGEESVSDTLAGILTSLVYRVNTTTGVLSVPNPTNPSELFCEAWRNDLAAYGAFISFVRNFEEQFSTLKQASGLTQVRKMLDQMFGETTTQLAFTRYTERMAKQRNLGLYTSGTAVGLTAAAVRTSPIPKNTFYGV